MMLKSTILVVGISCAATIGASAQVFGDTQKGQAYARIICAECHAVERAQAPSPNGNAPPFAAVATTPGITELALRTWLQTPHPTMPNLLLKPDERDNVIAYILSLKNPVR